METETINEQTPMREIEIFGVPALFTENEIPSDAEIPGMHHYQLFSAGEDNRLLGSVLTLIPVEVPESGERDVYDGDLDLDAQGETLTPEEFGDKYLSPSYGEDFDERYGKAD